MGIDGDVLRTNARRNQPVGVRAGGSALPGVGGAPEEKAWWCRAARAERTWNAKAGGAQERRITRRSSSRRLDAGAEDPGAAQVSQSGRVSGQASAIRTGTGQAGAGAGQDAPRPAPPRFPCPVRGAPPVGSRSGGGEWPVGGASGVVVVVVVVVSGVRVPPVMAGR
jgi:hypothetical protein